MTILCINSVQGIIEADKTILNLLEYYKIPYVIAYTKCDLASPETLAQIIRIGENQTSNLKSVICPQIIPVSKFEESLNCWRLRYHILKAYKEKHGKPCIKESNIGIFRLNNFQSKGIKYQ